MKRLVEKVKKLQNLSLTISKGDYDITLKNILLAQEQQTQEDLIYLEKQYTKIFPLFEQIKKQLKSKFKMEQLIKHLEIENFSQNQAIFRKGEIGRKMYFVLNGTLISYAYEQRDLTNQAANTLYQKGDHLGEISLHHRIPRTITVVCQTDVTLISVNYETYQNYIHSTVDLIISEQFRFIRGVNLFRNWNDLTYSIVLHSFRQQTLQRHQFIYKEDDKDLQIYIIKSGEVILQKQITVNRKKQENGLICLSQGQCFGDFEFLEDQSWLQDKSKIKQIKRKFDAKSTTESIILHISFLTYIRIQEDYHSSTISSFLNNSKQVIIQRMNQLQQQMISQKSKVEEDDFEQLEQFELKPIKIIHKPNNPYLSIMSNIKNNFKKDQTSQQTSIQIEQIAKQFSQKSILMKFDRGHKILLLKKLRDASVLPDSKDNFIYQSTVRSSLSRLKMSRINNLDNDTFFKPNEQPNQFSRSQTPNETVYQEKQNRQDRTSSQKTGKCQINDCHNFRLMNSQSRSISQLSINRSSLSKKSPTKLKFELEYEKNKSNSPMKECKFEIDLCIYGKQ